MAQGEDAALKVVLADLCRGKPFCNPSIFLRNPYTSQLEHLVSLDAVDSLSHSISSAHGVAIVPHSGIAVNTSPKQSRHQPHTDTEALAMEAFKANTAVAGVSRTILPNTPSHVAISEGAVKHGQDGVEAGEIDIGTDRETDGALLLTTVAVPINAGNGARVGVLVATHKGPSSFRTADQAALQSLSHSLHLVTTVTFQQVYGTSALTHTDQSLHGKSTAAPVLHCLVVDEVKTARKQLKLCLEVSTGNILNV